MPVKRSSLLQRTNDAEDQNESLPITRLSQRTPEWSGPVVRRAEHAAATVCPEAAVWSQGTESSLAVCPRCSGKLTDPGGLGWCQQCGYCQSLEDEKAKAPLAASAAAPQPSALGAVEMVEIARALPAWVWVLFGGVAAIVGATFVPGLALPQTGLVRAAWCTGQMVIGLLAILGAQIWALCELASEDGRLGNRDAILPVRLWVQVFRHLPGTVRQVWLGAWGLALVLSALIAVGGLSHWMTYLPKGSNAKVVKGAL
jgi:hypothetical protein